MSIGYPPLPEHVPANRYSPSAARLSSTRHPTSVLDPLIIFALLVTENTKQVANSLISIPLFTSKSRTSNAVTQVSMFFPLVTFVLFSLFSIAVLGVFWTSVAVILLAPALIGVTVFSIGFYATYYVSRRAYNKYGKPAVNKKLTLLGIRKSKPAASSAPETTSVKSFPNGTTSTWSRASQIVNKIAPGRIVQGNKDKVTNKKNWWKFVNKMDATVYMSEGERDEFYRRVNEVRERRQNARKIAEDSFSDIKDESSRIIDEVEEKPSETPIANILTPEVVGSAPSHYDEEQTQEEGDEGYGEGVPPFQEDGTMSQGAY